MLDNLLFTFFVILLLSIMLVFYVASLFVGLFTCITGEQYD